jgi:hypothetical protein
VGYAQQRRRFLSQCEFETTISCSVPCTMRPSLPHLHSCLYCKYPRPKDTTHQFCTHCGSQLPTLPDTDPTPPLQVSVCSNCRAHLPMGSTTCVVCEHTALHPSPIPVIQAQADLQQSLEVWGRAHTSSIHVILGGGRGGGGERSPIFVHVMSCRIKWCA